MLSPGVLTLPLPGMAPQSPATFTWQGPSEPSSETAPARHPAPHSITGAPGQPGGLAKLTAGPGTRRQRDSASLSPLSSSFQKLPSLAWLIHQIKGGAVNRGLKSRRRQEAGRLPIRWENQTSTPFSFSFGTGNRTQDLALARQAWDSFLRALASLA